MSEIKRIEFTTMTEAALKFGVSEMTITNWLMDYDILEPQRGKKRKIRPAEMDALAKVAKYKKVHKSEAVKRLMVMERGAAMRATEVNNLKGKVTDLESIINSIEEGDEHSLNVQKLKEKHGLATVW